ncbi:MAG: sensor histidine kinase [Ferruginibacter sp.]|nr:sensor histidine kinase [Ferruginibacter sp.]
MFNAVLISAVILVLIISFFIIYIVREHRKVLKWQQARIAAEVNTLENERKRIADDLHDELGPLLSAIKLQINHLEPSDETETAVLEKSSDQIDSIIQRFREISYDLLPNTLVRKGFIKATEEFIGKLKPLHPVNISFTYCDFTLLPEREINLYRILQEIIHNTVKHARATSLSISIQKNNKMLLLKTKDDGIGFNYSEKTQIDRGLGLLSIHSRVELLGGQVLVNTQPGLGTAFEIEMPL